MNHHQLQHLIAILLLGLVVTGCAGPAADPATATATSLPPTDVPTTVPPTPTATATLIPPTSTPTATPTPKPPTNTPTMQPTETPTSTPTATPTATPKPRPTNTKGPKPTARPSATQAPPAAPSSNETTVVVKNTFPVSCVIAFWGATEFKMDAPGDGMVSRIIQPGTYGWRAFLGGAETGEAGNLEITVGSTCLFICDMERLSIRYGCR